MVDDAVPALSEEEIKLLIGQLTRLRAAGRVALRHWLHAAELGLGGDLLLEAPCAFSAPKRGIAEASYRGEMRRLVA